MIRSALATTAIAALLAVVGASPAQAGTTSGAWKQSCYPKPGTYASLLVEDYNISGGKQRYKITAKGDTGPLVDVYVKRIWIDKVLVWTSPGGVTLKTLYKDYPTRTSRHTVKLEVFQGFDLIPNTCDVGPR